MISTYAWVSGGELPSQRLRSYTFGLAASTGFLVSINNTCLNAEGIANGTAGCLACDLHGAILHQSRRLKCK
jgi:hypothetical protein